MAASPKLLRPIDYPTCEDLIPGTPVEQMPPYCRPNFNAGQQLGYMTPGTNPAVPAPGTSVQRLTLQRNADFYNTVADVASITAGVNLAAGASIFLSQIPAVAVPQFVRAVITAFGAQQTNNLTLITAANGAGPVLNPDVPLILDRIDPSTIKVENNDSVAHFIGVLFTPVAPVLRPVAIAWGGQFGPDRLDLGAALGFKLNPIDVMVIRRLSLQIFAPEVSIKASRFALAKVFAPPGAAEASASFGTDFLLDGYSSDMEGQETTEGQPLVYVLRSPVSILGSDQNPGGSAFSPQLAMIIGSAGAPGNNMGTAISGQIDLYPGANQ